MHVYLILVLYELKITLMVRLGFEPGSAGWKAQEIFVTLKSWYLRQFQRLIFQWLEFQTVEIISTD